MITEAFSGKITKQSAMPLAINRTLRSASLRQRYAEIGRWGVTDLLDGKGSQRGYYNNVHADKGRDWGKFEGTEVQPEELDKSNGQCLHLKWPKQRGDREWLAEELEPRFTLALTPSETFSGQLGYNYNAISLQILICYTSSAALPGLPACLNLPGLLQQLAVYDSKVNTGFFDFIWTPLRRQTLPTGANLVGTTGSELNLSPKSTIPTTPTDALNSNWYQPYGSISYLFANHWTGGARWNYYGYHEDTNGSYQDLFASELSAGIWSRSRLRILASRP